MEATQKRRVRAKPPKNERWPVISIAGQSFYQIPRSDMAELFGDKVDLGDGPEILLPIRAPDDFLDFPAKAELEDFGSAARAGIATHIIDRDELQTTEPIPFGTWSSGFSATQLDVFPEDDWYGACWQVLLAHDWVSLRNSGGVSDKLLDQMAEISPGAVDLAKLEYEENWHYRVYELAAVKLAKPLSRIWYAANMLALYYVHHDDLRLGYLWCEYRMKLKYELPALRQLEVTEKNRESGSKGGQADKKRERYNCLDRLARQNFKELAFASDRDAMRLAKRLASDHDARADEPLFRAGGKLLSRDWFEDWLAHFRQAARGIE